jgi:hypothetical protein
MVRAYGGRTAWQRVVIGVEHVAGIRRLER